MSKVGRFFKKVTANFTRPADTTQYAAGEVVADSTSAPTVITFSGMAAHEGDGGYIVGALLVDSASEATAGSFELWLFDAAPGLDNDNAAFTPTDAEMRTLVGVITFDERKVGTASGNCEYRGKFGGDGGPLPFVCTSGERALYGELVVRNAYTPISEERFDILLIVDQN